MGKRASGRTGRLCSDGPAGPRRRATPPRSHRSCTLGDLHIDQNIVLCKRMALGDIGSEKGGSEKNNERSRERTKWDLSPFPLPFSAPPFPLPPFSAPGLSTATCRPAHPARLTRTPVTFPPRAAVCGRCASKPCHTGRAWHCLLARRHKTESRGTGAPAGESAVRMRCEPSPGLSTATCRPC
jgi:hypothetical protein